MLSRCFHFRFFEFFVPNLFLLPFLSFQYICVSITYEQSAGFEEKIMMFVLAVCHNLFLDILSFLLPLKTAEHDACYHSCGAGLYSLTIIESRGIVSTLRVSRFVTPLGSFGSVTAIVVMAIASIESVSSFFIVLNIPCKGNKTSAKHKINLFIFALPSAKTLSHKRPRYKNLSLSQTSLTNLILFQL